MCEKIKLDMASARGEDYWDLSTSSSTRLDFVNNDLWDGLFSPSNGLSFSSSNNVFKEQIVVDEDFDKEDGCSQRKNKPETVTSVEQQLFSSVLNESNKVSPSSQQSSSCPTVVDGSSISTNKSENTNSFDSANKISSNNSTIQLDYTRLKAEHRKLKEYFEADYKNRFKPLPIKETVRRLCNCEPTSLDLYISKKDKLDLLDEGRESGNCGLGRIVEATMEEFKIACQHKDPKKKLVSLRRCLIDGFHHPDLATERRFLQEWISLLEAHTK
uniref:Homeobox domain-containing protein n=1 Tax=Meloidogyne hapla TaxID=6305 RepID=A0A1I8BQR9_MELHA